NHGDHFARQADVLGFFGVDAQPGVVLHTVPACAGGLKLGQLPEVIAKTVDTAAVEAGPECRLTEGHAAHLGQRLVVVGHTGDHVNVRIDVIHRASRLREPLLPECGTPEGAEGRGYRSKAAFQLVS